MAAPPPPFEAEHEAFREAVRRFVDSELKPHVAQWESDEWFPDEVFHRLAELGWLGINVDERYGGQGAGPIYGAVFSEELARCGSGGVAAGIGAHIGIATPPINRFGSEDQKQRYLVPAVRGEKIGALAITEPGGGSDVAAARTRAERVEGGWVVNGAKTYITNGVRADFYVTAVRTRPEGGHGGMSFLIVDKGAGITASKLRKLGWHASDTAEIAFDDVFVPEENLLGELDRGFYLIMANFVGERLGMALVALGEMRESFQRTLAYARERSAFGRPIGSFQAIRHKFAEMATTIDASAALTYGALRRHVAGEDAVREVTMAKLFTQRANVRVQDECLQIHGGAGYMREFGIERALRDARLGPIGGGTDEIMREILGRGMGL